MTMLRSVITEYGVPWAVNRMLYNGKIALLKRIPIAETWFETHAKTSVQRLGIFDIDIGAIQTFLKALPDGEKTRLIQNANDACYGKILGFSSTALDYGNPINWQRNPLTGGCCDAAKKWYQIPDFDADRGDIKAIWEVSRFTHFYALARAFLLTGESRYYEAFSAQLSDWLVKNPYSFGANYKCGQECALRMINCLMSYTVFVKAGVACASDETNMKDMVSRSYRKILSNFFYAYRCVKNNHTISELTGMIIGAWCCEDTGRMEKAYRLLNEVIHEQFMRDGGYKQFSFNYQRLALQDIECILSIRGKTGIELDESALDRVRRSSLLLYQCQSAAGDVPNYGSNDGALIFPVTSCGYRDYRSVVNCIHALIDGKRLYESGLYDEELLWFAGGVDRYNVVNMPRISESFLEAGLFTLRSATRFAMLVLNDYQSRPAHMDQMHFDLWIGDVNVFCDSGTYSYASELGRELVHTGAHNTAKVYDCEQMNQHGAFMLCDWTSRIRAERSERRFDGLMTSKNGYAHHRQVEETNLGYSIIDEVQMKRGQKAEILYHTPCEVTRAEQGLLLSHQGKTLCSVDFGEADIEIEEAQRSRFYLQSETIRVIRVRRMAIDGRVRISTEIRVLGG